MDGLLMTFLINDNLAWEIDHLSRLADQPLGVNVLFRVEQVTGGLNYSEFREKTLLEFPLDNLIGKRKQASKHVIRFLATVALTGSHQM